MKTALQVVHNRFNIVNKLSEQYTKIEKIYGNRVFGVTLFGSQNYLLDTPNSDIDLKAIIIPSFDSLVKADKPCSFTEETQYGLIDYKDIREMFKQYQKQSINFVETLFTSYRRYNPSIWGVEWELLDKYKEKIARYNPHRTIKNASNMAYGAYYAKFIKSIKEYDWKTSIKSLRNLIRLEWFIETYIDEYGYQYCLVPDQKTKDYIMILENLEPHSFSIDFLKPIGDIILKRINKMTDEYTSKVQDKVNKETEEIMYGILKNIMQKSLVELEWS